jgi:hypothetical protein
MGIEVLESLIQKVDELDRVPAAGKSLVVMPSCYSPSHTHPSGTLTGAGRAGGVGNISHITRLRGGVGGINSPRIVIVFTPAQQWKSSEKPQL